MSASVPPSEPKSDLPSAAALSNLRDLLLGDEKVELSRISEDLAALKAQSDDPERFRQSVAHVMADALTDARTHDQVRLARAISPIVTSLIKREIVNSQDELVEALYPIMGRLIAASVRNSITKLADDINARLESMLSFKGMITRWRTQMAGGSAADVMLASTQKAVIQRAMIIEQGSGILIGQWQREDANQPDQANAADGDMDLVSGLLSAISNLADEAFGGENTELRTLDLNGSQVALRRSPKYIVALEFTGVLSADERLNLDAAFADCIERMVGDDQPSAFAPFIALADHSIPVEKTNAKTTAKATPKERMKSFGKMLAGLGVFALIIYGIWQWFEQRSLNADMGKIEAVINAEKALDGFPVTVKSTDGDGLTIKGLYPMRFNVERLNEKVQNAIEDRLITFDLRPVADADDIQALQKELLRLRQGGTQ